MRKSVRACMLFQLVSGKYYYYYFFIPFGLGNGIIGKSSY